MDYRVVEASPNGVGQLMRTGEVMSSANHRDDFTPQGGRGASLQFATHHEQLHVELNDDMFDSAIRLMSNETPDLFQEFYHGAAEVRGLLYDDCAPNENNRDEDDGDGDEMDEDEGTDDKKHKDARTRTKKKTKTGGGAGAGAGAGAGPGSGGGPPLAPPVDLKRSRVNVNQAEVQKRYRERKKVKMAELEQMVDDLRAKVEELEREKRQEELTRIKLQESFNHKLAEQKIKVMEQIRGVEEEKRHLLQLQHAKARDRSRDTSPSDQDNQQREDALWVATAPRILAGVEKRASTDPSNSSEGGKRSEGSHDSAAVAAVKGEMLQEIAGKLGANSDVALPGIFLRKNVTDGFDSEHMASILAAAQVASSDNTSDTEEQEGWGRENLLVPCSLDVLMTSLEYGVTAKDKQVLGEEGRGDSTAAVVPVVKRKFNSFTEAELWFGGVQDMYDLSVKKIRLMLQFGESDANLRAALSDLMCVVQDARKSKPDLAAVTTTQQSIKTLQEHGKFPIMDHCSTACALMAKSVVESSLAQSSFEAVVQKVVEVVVPTDIAQAIEWGEKYGDELTELYMRRSKIISKFESLQLPGGPSAPIIPGEARMYGFSVQTILSREGDAKELSRTLLRSMEEEMLMHAKACQELFVNTLSPRTAAAIVVHSHPFAPDPLALAFEFKKIRDARNVRTGK